MKFLLVSALENFIKRTELMRFFICHLQSPEQVNSFARLQDQIITRSRFSFFLIIKYNIRNQPLNSFSQYENSLIRLDKKLNFVISESIYARIYKLLFKILFFFPKSELIIGNTIGFHCKYAISKFHGNITIVDDGLVVLNIAKNLLNNPINNNLRLFTKYEDLLDISVLRQGFNGKLSKIISLPIVENQLGIIGSPLVEDSVLNSKELLDKILYVKKKLGVHTVLYFMHRREYSKFNQYDWLTEYESAEYTSFQTVVNEGSIPRMIWSLGSSALIDFRLGFRPEGMEYFFSRIAKVESENPLLYNAYIKMGFKEIQIPAIK